MRAVLVAVLLVVPLHAWQRATFSSRAVAVRVDVLATENGRPVAGLTSSDFELLDNGVPQRFDVANLSDLPVNAVISLDVSSSTEGQALSDLVGAGEAFVNALQPTERASLTTFSETVAPLMALTTDHAAVRRALASVTAGGQTAVIDGVFVSMMSAQSTDGRPLVVVFTDGLDTVSWMREADLINATKRASAVIYTVAAGPARQWQFLRDLATATGGRAIALASAKNLQAEFLKILTEFRSRYLLSFSPEGVSDTGYHTLTVRSKRRGVSVTARPGYTAAGR
ncbi:MAG: VWA domain-containing protein [Acidobacteria bacterium]|nr:MAG: VWA domain-containing protein [Acidobacteriota bacterium]